MAIKKFKSLSPSLKLRETSFSTRKECDGTSILRTEQKRRKSIGIGLGLAIRSEGMHDDDAAEDDDDGLA